jgi:hypothetical protein
VLNSKNVLKKRGKKRKKTGKNWKRKKNWRGKHPFFSPPPKNLTFQDRVQVRSD